MTSQINYTSINANYPTAGQNNPTQGFRDNFSLMKSNFETAASEISALQSNSIISGQFNELGSSTTIANGIFTGSRFVVYDFGTVSGTQVIDFSFGSYQKITLGGSVVVNTISNWPDSGVQAVMRVEIVVTNTNWNFTWPTAVTINYLDIANISSRTITFTQPGVYIFELSSIDGGTNIAIQDLSRNRSLIQGNLTLETLVNGVTTTGVSLTVSNIGGVVVGNVTADNFIGNIITVNTESGTFSGNVDAGNVIAANGIYGNILTAIQSNITMVGDLTSLSVTGNANVGNLTTTGMTDMCGGTQYGIQYVDAINGSSTNLFSNIGLAIIDPQGDIATYTLIMPATPANGQAIKIVFGNTISSLTHAGSGGQTLNGALTTAGNTAGGEWIYYTTSNKWFRLI